MKVFSRIKRRSGFTLIELLVAITIIGILATIGLRSFAGAQMKARDAKRKNDLAAMQKALEVYYNDFGTYPSGDSDGKIVGCDSNATSNSTALHTTCEWGSPFKAGDTTYIQELPVDPKGNYYYYAPTTSSGKRSYYLFARLENLDDSAVANNGSGPSIYRIPGAAHHLASTRCRNSGNIGCNYKIQSSNVDPSGNVILGMDN